MNLNPPNDCYLEELFYFMLHLSEGLEKLWGESRSKRNVLRATNDVCEKLCQKHKFF